VTAAAAAHRRAAPWRRASSGSLQCAHAVSLVMASAGQCHVQCCDAAAKAGLLGNQVRSSACIATGAMKGKQHAAALALLGLYWLSLAVAHTPYIAS